jgi:hypothetical protein
VTARWVVDAVAPERDLDITWKPISLYVKNEPPADSDYHDPMFITHRLLRVFLNRPGFVGGSDVPPVS